MFYFIGSRNVMSKMSSVKPMYKGLLIFGIIVFIIGLVCALYKEVPYPGWTPRQPYKDIGMILTIAGIVLTTLGFILPRKK